MARKVTTGILIALLIAAAALLAGCGGESGGKSGGENNIDFALNGAAEYLVENVAVDSFDSMGGGWVPMALKLSGTDAADDDYYAAYYDSIRVAVKNNGGVLSEGKPTANERVSMNLRALGKDPTNVEGADLMKVVDDYDVIFRQGLNAEIYALVSANYVGYHLSHEEDYLNDIIASQTPEGAFGMDPDHPDTDMTAMAVQALSSYDGRVEGSVRSDPRAEGAVDRALEWLKKQQQDDGSFGNAESTAQVMIALGCLGKDPVNSGFVKGENDLYDGLMTFHQDMGFSHEAEGDTDIMATEQSLLALDAIKLAEDGKRIFG